MLTGFPMQSAPTLIWVGADCADEIQCEGLLRGRALQNRNMNCLRINDVRGDHTIRFELFRGRQNQERKV
jgi:hypothetical protein